LGVELVDLGPRPVGHDLVADEAAAQAERLQIGIDVAELDRQHVLRHAADRPAVAGRRVEAALDQRLVVAGDQAFLAAVRVRQAPGLEVLLEVGAGAGAVRALAQRCGRLAGWLPLHTATDALAGLTQRRPGRRGIVALPA